jgi:hypothetical protein
VEEGVLFEGPCSLVVLVNESYAAVLEGQEEGEVSYEDMGVFERVEGKEMNGRGVWQVLGGMGCFLCYCYSTNKRWMVSDREGMEAGDGDGPMGVASCMLADSTAATPDQITGQWTVGDGTGWQGASAMGVPGCAACKAATAMRKR